MTVDQLLGLRSRGAVKRAGVWLDGPGRSSRAALVAAVRARGLSPVEDWEAMAGKQLLRLCLARTEAAQVRTNPVQRDEAFVCVNCGRMVPPGGRRPRDHCPFCLYALHVDIVPGDRAANCGGLLVPLSIEAGDLVYRCRGCGVLRRNRILDDVDPPDDPLVLAALARSRAGGG